MVVDRLLERLHQQLSLLVSLCASAPLRFILPLIFLAGCGKPVMHSQESYVFGTRVEVLVYGAPEAEAREGVNAVLREFDRLHHTFHAWQTSDLTKLNDAIARGDKDIPVSAEMAAMIQESKDLAEKSDELFDPAVGRLVEIWGFHNDEFKPVLPDPKKLADLVAARPRMRDITLTKAQSASLTPSPEKGEGSVERRSATFVTSANRAVALDFGGYAKGYALDRAAAILRGRGLNNALINIGGNIMALGSKGKEAWRVGIQNPRAPAPLAVLDMRDGEAVGTSGDYQRYFELAGKRYCHILDPRSGQPSAGAEGVTVLIPAGPKAGMLSDATSKPLFVAGAEHWRDYAKRQGVEMALRVDEAGVVHITPALHKRLSFADKTVKVVEEGL